MATNGLLSAGVTSTSSAILFSDGLETITNGVTYDLPQPTSATNIAGYICWGAHSSLGGDYALNPTNKWHGNSRWWIMETIESFNGQRGDPGQGTFIKWFSSNAFSGTNYSNTPVGAVSHVEEPSIGLQNNSSAYFGLWASGKCFAIAAWNSRNKVYFQAIGDPLVTR